MAFQDSCNVCSAEDTWQQEDKAWIAVWEMLVYEHIHGIYRRISISFSCLDGNYIQADVDNIKKEYDNVAIQEDI